MQKKFKLQKVLEYRDLVLEKEKARLAELMQIEETLVQKVKAFTEVIRLKSNELAQEEDFNLKEMYNKYINMIEVARRHTLFELAKHRQLVDAQKEKTVSAYRNKTIMDKLSDKHKKDYEAYVDKEEAKIVEDIVLTRKAAAINSEEFEYGG